MFSVELRGQVRHACHVEGLRLGKAARRFDVHRNSVREMLAFSAPPARPRLAAFTAIIDQVPDNDRPAPAKQRHTAK